MESHTLSTDDKEAILKMAGVLIRTKQVGDMWIAAKSRVVYEASSVSREDLINRAFRRITKE